MFIDTLDFISDAAGTKGAVFYYSGALTQNVIKTINESLRQTLQIQDDRGVRSRKLFSTFVEMTQNAMHYSSCAPDTKDVHEGTIIICKEQDKYFLVSKNLIANEHKKRVTDKLDAILRMDPTEIKQAYRTQLKNERHAEENAISKGAGLGFLTIARDSIEPIEYAIVDSEDKDMSFFYFKATV